MPSKKPKFLFTIMETTDMEQLIDSLPSLFIAKTERYVLNERVLIAVYEHWDFYKMSLLLSNVSQNYFPL